MRWAEDPGSERQSDSRPPSAGVGTFRCTRKAGPEREPPLRFPSRGAIRPPAARVPRRQSEQPHRRGPGGAGGDGEREGALPQREPTRRAHTGDLGEAGGPRAARHVGWRAAIRDLATTSGRAGGGLCYLGHCKDGRKIIISHPPRGGDGRGLSSSSRVRAVRKKVHDRIRKTMASAFLISSGSRRE